MEILKAIAHIQAPQATLSLRERVRVRGIINRLSEAIQYIIRNRFAQIYNGSLILTFSQREKEACGAVLLSLILLLPLTAHAQHESRQDKIEAAFLYNFFNYITWPGDKKINTDNPAIICLDKDSSLHEALDYIRVQKANDLPIKIEDVDLSHIPDECHIAFIDNPKAVSGLVHSVKSTGILLVSNLPEFLDHGGMIELTRDKERLMLHINNTMMMKDGLQASSKLLAIAAEVR